jgi:nicotinamidase-related amidase
MGKVTMADVMAASYSITEQGLQYLPAPTKKNTALLLIDIQGLATPEHLAENAVAKGLDEKEVNEALADYRGRFYAALDSCKKLLAAARANGIPAIHVKIEGLSGDGRDAGLAHKLIGWILPPGNEAARFLDECKPNPGEIVLTKTVSGAFTGTILDRVLDHMGIKVLYVAGFVTDECVDTTVRTALDMGYFTSVVSDATTTYFKESYQAVIDKFAGWGITTTTEIVVNTFAALPEA